MSSSPARRAAWELLCALHRGRDADIPLPVLLERSYRKYNLDGRDSALCSELVHGVLRHEGRVRALLAPFVRNPEKLPPDLRVLLSMATWELLFLDIPARATIHESVELARRKFGPGLGKLTNAVLRGLDRQRDETLAADATFMALEPEKADAAAVARAGSLPLWLAELWLSAYGPQQAWALALASATRPVACWRLNASAPDREDIAKSLLGWGAARLGGYAFSFSSSVTALPPELFQLESEGKISRQGPGAVLAAELLADSIESFCGGPGRDLWDACCGRGGKSCALLERGVGISLCSDPSSRRLDAFKNDLQRLRLSKLAESADLAAMPELEIVCDSALELGKSRSFSLILLDVPCSGSGTLARNPELRLRLSLERLKEAVELQGQLLEQGWQSLKSGGLLAYMTCALAPAENEKRIGDFCERHPEARVLDQKLLLPEVAGQDSLFMALLSKPA